MPRTRGTFRDSIPRAQLRARCRAPQAVGRRAAAADLAVHPPADPAPLWKLAAPAWQARFSKADGQRGTVDDTAHRFFACTRQHRGGRLRPAIACAGWCRRRPPLPRPHDRLQRMQPAEATTRSMQTIASADARGILVNSLRLRAHPTRLAPRLAGAPHGAAQGPRNGVAARGSPLPWLAHGSRGAPRSASP